eukprot:87992-Prorocentrum_minimum.AAC.2
MKNIRVAAAMPVNQLCRVSGCMTVVDAPALLEDLASPRCLAPPNPHHAHGPACGDHGCGEDHGNGGRRLGGVVMEQVPSRSIS